MSHPRFDASACANSLADLLASWQTYFKYSVHYLGSSLDNLPLTEEERFENQAEYFKFSTTWTYENEIQPVAARAINVEFTLFNPNGDSEDFASFRVEHEQLVRRIPSTHARDQSIDLILLRVLHQKRTVATEWKRDYSANSFFASRLAATPLDEERNLDRVLLPSSRPVSGSIKSPHRKTAVRPSIGSLRASNPEVDTKLLELFRAADHSNTGLLDRTELHDLLMQSDLGLLDDDIPILMAAAEEDQNGRLLYDEFVPVGIDIAEALLIRRSTRQGQERAAGERGGEEAESIVHGLSASALRETLETACSEFGIGADDQLSRSDLRDLLLTLHLNLTKLEVNSVLARVREDFVSMQQFVQRFPAILEQISQNAILLNDAGDLETVLLRQFQACDVDGADTVLTSQLRDVLLHLPRVTLSRAQVYTIMAEAEADAGGLVSYRSFARAAAACIRRMLEPRSVEMRRELLFGSDTSAAQLLGGREKAALEIELREQFAECDPDANGVLEIAQFRRCLESATLGLTPRQGTALVNVADISDDGQIDYFEFVRFAYDVLLTMAREVKLQEMLDAQR